MLFALRITLGLVLGTLPSLCLAAQFDLQATIKYALEHSPELLSEKNRNSIAGLDSHSARNRFLPSLDLESQHGLSWNRPLASSTEPWVSSVNLKLTETLYDNGESLTLWKKAKANQLLTEATLSQVRGKLLLDLVQTYYDYSRHSFLLSARKQQKELYEKQNATTAMDYRQGLKTRKDYLRFKAQAQKAVIDERAEQRALEKTAIQLSELMGLGMNPDTRNSTGASFEVVPAEKLILEVPTSPPPIENVPEYQLAVKAAGLKGYDVNLAQRKNLPIINLSGNANYGYSSYLGSTLPFNNTKQYGAQVILGLSYNIWDWGSRRNEVEKASAEEQIAKHQLEKTRLAVESGIRNLMLLLGELKENRLITLELMKNQETAYQLIRRDYEEGRVQYIDLVQSLQDLFDAKALHYNAHYQLGQALAQYHYLEGRIYEILVH